MSAADIFGGDADLKVARYDVTIQIRELIVGGVPSEAGVIRGWLRARLELEDAALEEMLTETVKDRDEALSVEDKVTALVAAGAVSINGFKRDRVTGELYYEGRCMKAALKEFMNSAYPGSKWPGQQAVAAGYRKGMKNWAAEYVHVTEDAIGLGVKEPTRVEERIKHLMTPQGPRSAISRVEVVERPTLRFTVTVKDDLLPRAAWGRVWQFGEDIGVGTDRGRSDGKFDLLDFTRTE